MTTRPASTADPIPGAQPMPGERTVLDPTGERSEAIRELSARPPSLDGLTVGLLDISKARARLHWQPRWRLGTALSHIVAWHQAWLAGQDMRALCLQQIAQYTAPQTSSVAEFA